MKDEETLEISKKIRQICTRTIRELSNVLPQEVSSILAKYTFIGGPFVRSELYEENNEKIIIIVLPNEKDFFNLLKEAKDKDLSGLTVPYDKVLKFDFYNSSKNLYTVMVYCRSYLPTLTIE